MNDPSPAVRFGRLWAHSQPAVAGFLRSLVGDPGIAEELEQDVATAAFLALPTYDATRPFTSWVLGIARNQYRLRCRSLARNHAVLTDPRAIVALAQAAEEEEADGWERERGALRQCLEILVGQARKILALHYVEGLTPAVSAQRLGLSPVHARVLLHRTRGVLRSCVERRLTMADDDHG